MSETPDCPKETVEEADSTEDLLALLAPGGPAAAMPRESTREQATPAVPDRAVNYGPEAVRSGRSGPPGRHPGLPQRAGAEAVSPAADLVAAPPVALGPGALGAPGTLGAPNALRAPSARGAPYRTPVMPGSSAAAPVRIGSRFQPLPGTLPTGTGPTAPAGAGLVLVAAAGTPVHAVEAGTVTLGAQPDEPLRLAGDGGMTFYYGGLAPGSVTVADGAQVAAGTILGTVAAPRLSRTSSPPVQPHLVLRIVDQAGVDVDVARFLVGLPDPNELGQAAVGAGVDVDPDALDREIAGAAAGPTWEQPP